MLNGNPMGDAGVKALLPSLGQVEDLWLGNTAITDAGLQALIDARPPNLRGLWVDSNQITDAGLAALVRSPLLGQLHGLSVYQPTLTLRGHGLLAGHPLAAAVHGTTRLPGVHALWFQGRPDGA
jgi:hypothetical protein